MFKESRTCVQLTLKAIDFAIALVQHSVQDPRDVVKAAGGEVVVVGLVPHGGTGEHDVVPFLCLLPVRAIRGTCGTTVMLRGKFNWPLRQTDTGAQRKEDPQCIEKTTFTSSTHSEGQPPPPFHPTPTPKSILACNVNLPTGQRTINNRSISSVLHKLSLPSPHKDKSEVKTHRRAKVVADLVSKGELRDSRGHGFAVVDDGDDACVEALADPRPALWVVLVPLTHTPCRPWGVHHINIHILTVMSPAHRVVLVLLTHTPCHPYGVHHINIHILTITKPHPLGSRCVTHTHTLPPLWCTSHKYSYSDRHKAPPTG